MGTIDDTPTKGLVFRSGFHELCCTECSAPIGITYSVAWPGTPITAWCYECLPPRLRMEGVALRKNAE